MAETTLFPAAQLPTCLPSCGVLYNVNGACVPPHVATAASSVYQSCFCNDPRLTAWMTTTTDLCDGGCPTATDLASIESWYTSYCSGINDVVATQTASTSSTDSSTPLATSNQGGGGSWISTHWNWVIFLVVVVVGITGIWVGSWAWRKHYLAKKERQYALGKNMARGAESGSVAPVNPSPAPGPSGPGMFNPAPIGAAVYGEKPREKKRWIVKERT